MFHHSETKAVCRGCGLELRGGPHFTGKPAYHPRTGDRCKTNFYGGYVCSASCDFRASLDQEQSMPGHSWAQKKLGRFAQEAFNRNWQDSRP